MRAVIAALVAALLPLLAMVGTQPYAVRGAVVVPMAQCAQEDGSGPQAFPCVWDADTRGNGKGRSYVLTSADGPTLYVR